MFDDNNYAYWKVRIRAFLKSLDEKDWLSVENGCTKLATPVAQWSDEKIAVANYNSRAMNAIFNGVSPEQFKKISNFKVAKSAWAILLLMREQKQLKLTNFNN